MHKFSFKIRLFSLSAILTCSVFLISSCGKNYKNSGPVVEKAVKVASDGNWRMALSYSEIAMKTDPSDINAKVIYALSLENTGKKTETIKELRTLVSQNPKEFIPQLLLGKLLYDNNELESAYENLTNAYNLNPQNVEALQLLSQCAMKLQTESVPQLLNKLSETPQYKDSPIIFNDLGVYYVAKKKYSEAASNLIKAYQSAPDNPTILLNMGILCDKYLNSSAKSKFFYRKFISITNDNASYSTQKEEVISRLKQI